MTERHIIRRMAVNAYRLDKAGILDRLASLPNWEYGWGVRRIVPIELAMKRLVKRELAELVYLGFVLLIETDSMAWIPVRTWDFMTGLNSDSDVQIAVGDVELARALKGNEAPLDEML